MMVLNGNKVLLSWCWWIQCFFKCCYLICPWSWLVSSWNHQMEAFSASLAICEGIHRSPVNSPHKGQWRGSVIFSLICARTNVWTNHWDTSVLRRHRVHYDVTVMLHTKSLSPNFRTPGTEIKRRKCRPSGHYWNHSMRTLSNCSNHCISFEGGEPLNEIYRYPMVEWLQMTSIKR